MSTSPVALVDPMSERKKRDDAPQKIDRQVLRLAAVVAASRGISVAEYLSERVRPFVEQDHREYAEKVIRGEIEPVQPKPRKKKKRER